MATANPPYISAHNTIAKALERLKKAPTPEKFSQDFLSTKLDMKGGSPKQVIPYLKRIGFLGPDGKPTELYVQFRNETQSGVAAAEALRTGYRDLYSINEYIHDADDDEIMGAIIQITGDEKNSKRARAILASFKVLRNFADFDARVSPPVEEDKEPVAASTDEDQPIETELRIGYTINLNLPATSDVAVFNAIFKSLRENLLR